MDVREASASYAGLTELPSDAVPFGYKQTEIGVLPADWSGTTLDSIAFVTSGKRLPLGTKLTERETPHPYIRVTDMREGTVSLDDLRYVPIEAFPAIKNYRIFEKDIFISVAGTLGLVGKIPRELDGANLTENADRITNIMCVQGYLLHVLASPCIQNTIEELRTVGAQPKLALERIRKFQIPLPPTTTEQEAIAEALSDADALIESLEQLIAKKRQIKQGTMQALLTGKQRLPGFSGALETRCLEQLGRWVGGMTPSMREVQYWQSGTIPWISSGDVKLTRLTETSQYITAFALKERATTLVPEGSIVVVMRSGILRKFLPVAMSMVPMAINQDLKALILQKDICADYVLHALISSGEEILATCLKSGTTVESIEFGWLKAFTILLPSVEEQTAIATILTDMDTELTELETRLAKTRELKQGMMQELLTGRIRLI
ncbi:MAG: restriction endonuclease subunit S [Rhodanobacter sp.]